MRTLREALQESAKHTHKGMTFLRSDGGEQSWSYAELWRKVLAVAQALAVRGVSKGDRVALAIPEPDEFVLTFFAAIVLGAVPVPVYPPHTLARLDDYFAGLRRILMQSGAKVLLASDRTIPRTTNLGIVARLSPEELHDHSDLFDPASVSVTPDDLAFLQFTSGSTSDPKGVAVTHANLSANSHAIMFDGLQANGDTDRGLSWLPLYHDMGLIGFVIAPIFAQVPVTLLQTSSFIRRPSQWLSAINKYRATITFAPNFAFSLCVRGISERQMEGWDLSCLRVLGCGAEPIDPPTVRAFLDKFASVGLPRTALLPSYGLAESTLAVTFTPLARPLRTHCCDPAALRSGKATQANGHGSVEIISCGTPFPDHKVEVVGQDDQPLPERHIGEVTVRGPSVSPGYYRAPREDQSPFRHGRLHTGDLGYLLDGELYICGRLKDLIISRGRNYYPQDIEKVISEIEGVRAGQVAVFACGATTDAPASRQINAPPAETVVAVAEATRAAPDGDVTLETTIASAVLERTGLKLDRVVLIARGTLPKTSSGKVRRSETKDRLFAGSLLTRSSEA